MSMGIRTVCRAPTNYYYDKPLPSLPAYDSFDIETELVPKPFFSRPIVLPPTRATYAVIEPLSPIYVPSITSTGTSQTPSLLSSRRSVSPSISSASATLSSAPSSPYSQRRSPTLTYSSLSTMSHTPVSNPEPRPRRPLRRRVSPTHETLRSIRAKESDACLQRAYDEQVSAYLSGALFSRVQVKSDLDVLQEDR